MSKARGTALFALLAFISCDPAYAQLVIGDEYPHTVTFVADIDPHYVIFEYEFSRAPGIDPWVPVEAGPHQVAHVCFEQVVGLTFPDGWLKLTIRDIRTGLISREDVIVVPEPPRWAALLAGGVMLGVVRGKCATAQGGLFFTSS